MTEKVALLPKAQFVSLWNAAWSVDEVVAVVAEPVAHVPKWEVLARAAALRSDGRAEGRPARRTTPRYGHNPRQPPAGVSRRPPPLSPVPPPPRRGPSAPGPATPEDDARCPPRPPPSSSPTTTPTSAARSPTSS